MIFREALISDIQQMQVVRNSVRENVLSDPSVVKDSDCEEYLLVRGKGWVCEVEKTIVGFSIADLTGNNIWALFVLPEYEGKGIGKILHSLMLNWYFEQTRDTVWLGTSPGTRAEDFYRKYGWNETGTHGKGEIKFELTYNDWVDAEKILKQ
ncbi:MAG: GNAT family N-acetyltransferase [Ginsengibacter sp.]